MNKIFINSINAIRDLFVVMWQTFTLAVFLIIFIFVRILIAIFRHIPIVSRSSKIIKKNLILILKKISRKITFGKKDSIDQIDLIELSFGNMRMRKTRTFVTIGGMTIGIAIIVFLVSVGYGLQNLVVSRVAKLDQMKQVEVSLHSGSKMKITDQTISSIQGVNGVTNVFPIISVVSKINYNNSVSDMVAYGVTSDYLKNSDIRLTQGEIFQSNELTNNDLSVIVPSDESAGVQQDIMFSIKSGEWAKVRESSDRGSKLLGYTKSGNDLSKGKDVEGGEYVDENGSIQKDWIVSTFQLWTKKDCSKVDCSDSPYKPVSGIDGKQLEVPGSIASIGVNIKEDHDDDNDANLNDKSLDSNASTKKTNNKIKEAVVNQAMLQVLGIDESQAIGKQFSSSFVVVGNLLGDGAGNKESQKMQYQISGVVAEGKNPIFYVPFIDVRALGVVNYSQLKVVANTQDVLPRIREQINTAGYATSSVSDTVDQINSFFTTAKTILGLVGMVALFIASLGMFNTLTVSLLERTREVGLLKAMGMRSGEVRNLFLTESIIMSFMGGVFGVVLGVFMGNTFSAIASVYSVSMGFDTLNITYVPWRLGLGIVAISLFVGFLTGIYPARRAQKISALNALRYE
ncbi:MAG: FtsX-like permease family protein [bacterium]